MAFWYLLAFRAAAVLPYWFKRAIAQWIAQGYFFFNGKQRRSVISNLRIIRPDASHGTLLRLAMRTFQQAGLNLLDFFSIPSVTDEHIRSMAMNFNEVHALLEQRSGGSPFCLVTGHYGHWELAGAILGAAGYKTHAIALTQNSPVVQRLYESLRVRFGVTAHDVRYGLRQLLRDLPEGEIPAIVSDREYGTGGESVEFFGHMACFPRGTALLCHRRNLVGIPGFLIRQPNGRFLLQFGDPIHPESSDEKTWIRAFVVDFARQYERVISQDPTQFLTFYDFWDGVA
jgi:KDO2-lipid IV(A) lauroyltransferase